MFTGIIAKTSKVQNMKTQKSGATLSLINNLGKIKTGESININGVCSTVKKTGKNAVFQYMPETIKLSNLGFLKSGDKVNTERSVKFGDRLDGHIVLGHVDGRGKIVSINKEGNSRVFKIKAPNKKLTKFLVYKGSVAVEGVSLTVAKIAGDNFIIKVLPYTLKHTNLELKKKNDTVNLEFDILAKYARSLCK